jgi:putative endonuclease
MSAVSASGDPLTTSQTLPHLQHVPDLLRPFWVAQSVRLPVCMHGIEKRIVYIICSDRDPNRRYVGLTNDMGARLEWHNAGPCGYTIRHRPWRVLVTIEFSERRAAAHFEKYLKSGSGRAFAKRHFAAIVV